MLPQPGTRRDPFVPLLLLLAAMAGGFEALGGRGRVVEVVFVFAAVGAGYALVWSAARLLPFAAAAGYLALEQHFGRLDGRHYWENAMLAAASAAVVFFAAYMRLITDRRRDALLDAHAALEAERAAGTLGVGTRMLPPLEYELERARRHNHQVSLLVVRPDDLHHVESGHGEAGVAAVRQRLSEVLVRQLRATDVPLHEPPADFWVVLPETPPLEARAAGERVRLALSAQEIEFSTGDFVHLSVSIGGASFPDDGATNLAVEEAAVRALERAAELGGNRCVMHSLPPEVPRGWALPAEATP